MAYNTGNPIGSIDPRDAADNKENFDRFALSTDQTYTDRLGVARKTVTGTLQDYAAYNLRGSWTTATAYQVNDIWRDGPSGAFYLVLADYTSGASAAADIAGGNVVVHQPKDWVLTADNVAALRTIEPAFDGQQVELLGHTVAGVGCGIFYHDASDTTSADNNVDVIVTSGGARWKKRRAPAYIPARFTSADIQELIDAGADSGAAVELLPGTNYTIDEPIVLRAGVKIFGNSQLDTYLDVVDDLSCFTQGSTSDQHYHLEDFRIIGQASASVSPLIDINTSPSSEPNSYHVFKNLFMRYGAGGMKLAGKGMSAVSDVRVQYTRGIGYDIQSPDGHFNNIHTINSHGHGISVAGANNRFTSPHSTWTGREATDSNVNNYHITGSRNNFTGPIAQNGYGHGAYFDGCHSVNFIGADIDNNAVGITGAGLFFKNAGDLVVSGTVDNYLLTGDQDYVFDIFGAFIRNHITIRGRNQGVGVCPARPIGYTTNHIDIILDNDSLRMTPDYQIIKSIIDDTESDFTAAVSARKLSDTTSRVAMLSGGRLRFGSGSAAHDAGLYRPSAGVVSPETTTILQIINATYQYPFRIGTISLWKQSGVNTIRAYAGLPTADTDGSVLIAL